jgi:hypothetical protein
LPSDGIGGGVHRYDASCRNRRQPSLERGSATASRGFNRRLMDAQIALLALTLIPPALQIRNQDFERAALR